MSDYNDEIQMMPIRSRSSADEERRSTAGVSGGSGNRNGSGNHSGNGNGSRRRRKKRKPVFYKVLLLSFLAGLVVIAIVLLVVYRSLEGYEERAVARRSEEASRSVSRYNSEKLSAETSFSISAEEAAKTSREEEIRISAERSAEEIAKTVVTDSKVAILQASSFSLPPQFRFICPVPS